MICKIDSPLGIISLQERDGALISLEFTPDESPVFPQTSLLTEAARQLNEYFAGIRYDFSLPLRPTGTPFQMLVWQALLRIPYGQSRSYVQLAQMIGNPRACRAVGSANGKNPLPILIPCHRVIASGGHIGGYSCGIDRKKFLLKLENIPFIL